MQLDNLSLESQVLADLAQHQPGNRNVGRSAGAPSLDVVEARQLASELRAPAIFFTALVDEDGADLPRERKKAIIPQMIARNETADAVHNYGSQRPWTSQF